MGIINNNSCAVCEKKMNFFEGKYGLGDGSLLCKKCFNQIPSQWRNYAQINWGLLNYNNFKNFYMPVNNENKKKFNKTDEYKDIVVDKENLLFYFKSIPEYILSFFNVIDCIFKYNPEKEMNNFFSKKVSGKFSIYIEMALPKVAFEIVLSTAYITKVYDFNGKKNIKMTDETLRFENLFFSCINQARTINEENIKKNNYQENVYKDNCSQNSSSLNNRNLSNYDKALALFMLDSVDNIDESQLKKIRNKLIKSFHPDNDEDGGEYAKKINNAFNILKENL